MEHCLTDIASKLYPLSATQVGSFLCSGKACLTIMCRNRVSVQNVVPSMFRRPSLWVSCSGLFRDERESDPVQMAGMV